MIVFEHKRLVILTPPHTASRSLHTACCEIGAMYVVGSQPDGTVDHHTTQIAADWSDFQVAVIVRHPFDRLVGLYEHHSSWMVSQGWLPVPWWLFVAHVLEKYQHLSWLYTTTITEWLGSVSVDHVIPYETLTDSLTNLLKTPIQLPEAPTKERDWSKYLRDEKPLLQVEYWGREDMKRWRYSTRLVKEQAE